MRIHVPKREAQHTSDSPQPETQRGENNKGELHTTTTNTNYSSFPFSLIKIKYYAFENPDSVLLGREREREG